MKNINTSILLVALAILMTNCKKDDDPGLSAQLQATQNLSVTWGEAEVLSSPGGSFGTLEDLTLTFEVDGNLEPTGFSATGAPDYFLSSSSSNWSWENATSTAKVNLINVTPVQQLTLVSLSATSLTINFQYDGPEGGRVQGIGEYEVKLARQ